MPQISELSRLQHEDLEGVLVYLLTGPVASGSPQEVLVEVEPRMTIPLHKHSVSATMIIVGGSGVVLSGDHRLDGQKVERGKVVFFEREVLHGFRAGSDGLTFISRNGGIVAESGEEWDMEFA